jgi:hypothetical protein
MLRYSPSRTAGVGEASRPMVGEPSMPRMRW